MSPGLLLRLPPEEMVKERTYGISIFLINRRDTCLALKVGSLTANALVEDRADEAVSTNEYEETFTVSNIRPVYCENAREQGICAID